MIRRPVDHYADTIGHYSTLVNRADVGDLDSHDVEAGRVWVWMLVDLDDPDRGILDGCDTWEPLTVRDARAAARAALDRENAADPYHCVTCGAGMVEPVDVPADPDVQGYVCARCPGAGWPDTDAQEVTE